MRPRPLARGRRPRHGAHLAGLVRIVWRRVGSGGKGGAGGGNGARGGDMRIKATLWALWPLRPLQMAVRGA